MTAPAVAVNPDISQGKVEPASEMLRSVSAAPCPQLRQYVRAYAQREVERTPLDIVLAAPAVLEPILEFDFANPVIVEQAGGKFPGLSHISLAGPRTWRKFEIRLRGPVKSFGVFFQPLGLRQLFGVPYPLLVDTGFSAPEVLGKGICQLWERMAEKDSFEERVRLVEACLLEAAENPFSPTGVMESASHLFRANGAQRVDDLAFHAGLSVRHYGRRFVDEIGITPKLFARIARFQGALDMKLASPGVSWLAIAHALGYHDQMHMIRDFRVFVSDTPGGICPNWATCAQKPSRLHKHQESSGYQRHAISWPSTATVPVSVGPSLSEKIFPDVPFILGGSVKVDLCSGSDLAAVEEQGGLVFCTRSAVDCRCLVPARQTHKRWPGVRLCRSKRFQTGVN